jgi:hypothetical protein
MVAPAALVTEAILPTPFDPMVASGAAGMVDVDGDVLAMVRDAGPVASRRPLVTNL